MTSDIFGDDTDEDNLAAILGDALGQRIDEPPLRRAELDESARKLAELRAELLADERYPTMAYLQCELERINQRIDERTDECKWLRKALLKLLKKAESNDWGNVHGSRNKRAGSAIVAGKEPGPDQRPMAEKKRRGRRKGQGGAGGSLHDGQRQGEGGEGSANQVGPVVL